jgi:WD40 repeat protein
MLFKKSVVLLLVVILCLNTGILAAQDDPVRVIPVQGMMVARIRLSPDGQTLAVFEDINAVGNQIDLLHLPLHLIDVATGTERLLMNHTDYATDAVFTPDSTRLISYHANGYLLVWDVTSGEMVKEIPAVTANNARLLMLPDGKTLAVLLSSFTGQILLWDIETGAITTILANRPSSYSQLMDGPGGGTFDSLLTFAVSPDGSMIATASLVDDITIWDVAAGQSILLRDGNEDLPMINIRYLQFLPDNKTLMYTDYGDNMAHFWDVTTASEIQTIPLSEKAHAVVSDDGSRIAWVSPDENTLTVADVAQPDNQTVIDLPATDLEYAPFSMATLFFAGNTQLVFSSFLAGDGNNQIYVIDIPE